MSAPTADDLIQARALSAEINSHSDAIERSGRLPPELVEKLNRHGLLAMTIPRQLGGTERTPLQVLQVIEELAYADSAVAWCSMIHLTTAVSAAQLPAHWAEQIYAVKDRVPITSGVTAPMGRARVCADGLEVSGRWAWGSGSHHSDWICGGCFVTEGDGLRSFASGAPQLHVVFFERSQVELQDNWNPSGLAGTGSVDFEVNKVQVPEGRWIVQGAGPLVIDNPLYRYPFFGFFASCIAAVPLGIARRALADFVDLAQGKTLLTGNKTISESSLTQLSFGQAEAQLEAARRYLLDVTSEVWESVLAGDEPSMEQRRQLRMAATQSTIMAAATVDSLYNAGGGSSIHGHCPLQRHFRDIHVATQHRMLATGLHQLSGAMRLADKSEGLAQL